MSQELNLKTIIKQNMNKNDTIVNKETLSGCNLSENECTENNSDPMHSQAYYYDSV